jgi:hypothetical protein
VKPNLDVMNHSVTRDATAVDEARGPKTGGPESRAARTPSLSLVWAITIGEAVLWGAFAAFFADYWLMLPVRYRWAGILILAFLAAIGLFRLARFYRRFSRRNERRTSL